MQTSPLQAVPACATQAYRGREGREPQKARRHPQGTCREPSHHSRLGHYREEGCSQAARKVRGSGLGSSEASTAGQAQLLQMFEALWTAYQDMRWLFAHPLYGLSSRPVSLLAQLTILHTCTNSQEVRRRTGSRMVIPGTHRGISLGTTSVTIARRFTRPLHRKTLLVRAASIGIARHANDSSPGKSNPNRIQRCGRAFRPSLRI